MKAIIILTTRAAVESGTHTGYIIGAIIALFILGYLIYSISKPEKF